jgi:hypothetical protein
MENTTIFNYLKVRDDHRPIKFYMQADDSFRLCEDSEVSWLSKDQEFKIKDLRTRIEPWLTSLFQSEHLSLLVGSGLTHAIHKIATGQNAAGMDLEQISVYKEELNNAAIHSAEKSGRKTPNIEDQIRVVNELLSGLEILGDENADGLRIVLEQIIKKFSHAILENEQRIACAKQEKREEAFNCLVSFLMSFASRTGTRDRLNVFTTNYDRLIEAGAELAGLYLLDRFVGTLTPIFRSSRLNIDMHYNPPGIRGEPRYLEGVARFTKLHGSLDWVQVGDVIRRIGLPFGAKCITPYMDVSGIEVSAHRLMIYPNAAKDRETAGFPYVELFRDFAAAICRPNGTLVTYGYSFGDEHINRVILDMLTIPSTHLVIISYDDPIGKIMDIYNKSGRTSQISLLVGPVLADIQKLTGYFLPKSAIDKATFRMSELLRHRFGTEVKSISDTTNEEGV